MPHPAVKAAGVVLIVAGSIPYFQSLYEVGVEYYNTLIGEGLWAVNYYLAASLVLESMGLTSEAYWLKSHAQRALLHLANLFIADMFGGLYAIKEDFEIAFGFKKADCRRVARAQGRIAGMVTLVVSFIYSSYKAGAGLAKAVKDGLKRFGWGLATPAIYDLITIGYGGVTSIRSSYLLRLLYSAELDFVEKLRGLVDREGVLNVKSKLDKVVKWVKILFDDCAEDHYKAKWLAEIGDEISKDPNLEGLAVKLGEFVEDPDTLMIAHEILEKIKVLDESVKVKVVEFLGVLDRKYARVVLSDLVYLLENWHPYYIEILDESIKSEGRFLPRKVSYRQSSNQYWVYIPASWGSVIGGIRYVVFRIPGVGEEVCRVSKGSITISRAVVDVLEDYKRSVVLVSPEVYNAGFIGVVSSEPRFKVPDDYVPDTF